MIQIHWESAPKDAEYCDTHNALFYKIVGQQAYYADELGNWKKSATAVETIRVHYNKRPTAPESVYPSTSVEFLDNSKKLQQERGKQYDSTGGERSFDKVAAMFTAATGIALEGHHIALIQTHLKHVRAYANTSKVHQDSLEDAVSYCALWAEQFKSNISKKE